MSDSVEVAVPDVQQVVSEAPPAPEEAGEGREVKPEEKEKPVKEKKPKKKTEKKPKHHKVAAHPPYFQMIKDAITALNEKNGSSPYAIAKYIEAEHSSFLPANFRKILSLQLKNSTARGKLIKIKASYKLSQAGKKEKAATTRSARANAVKPEETVTKRRRSSRSKSVNQMQMEATEKAKAAAAGGRRMRKSAPATKPKQPKSIKSTVKKTKKAAAV